MIEMESQYCRIVLQAKADVIQADDSILEKCLKILMLLSVMNVNF